MLEHNLYNKKKQRVFVVCDFGSYFILYMDQQAFLKEKKSMHYVLLCVSFFSLIKVREGEKDFGGWKKKKKKVFSIVNITSSLEYNDGVTTEIFFTCFLLYIIAWLIVINLFHFNFFFPLLCNISFSVSFQKRIN